MREKNLCLIIVHPHFTTPGGAGKVVLEIGKRLTPKIKVVVIAQQIESQYILEYPEIEFVSLNGPLTSSLFFWLLLPLWQIKLFRKINEYRKKTRVVLLCNVFPANWLGLPYKLLHPKIRCLWFCHEPSAFIHIKEWQEALPSVSKRTLARFLAPFLKVIDCWLASLPDLILVNSQFTLRNVRKIYKREGVVIYPGVDLRRFRPLPFEKKKNYILTVGRLSKFKRIDLLLRAIPKIKNQEIQVIIVGKGEEEDHLRQLAARLGIAHRVRFLSEVDNKTLARLYAEAKVFILTSHREPFGIVPLEAMACGTPVIVDKSGGPAEYVSENSNGQAIRCTPATLARTIDALLQDERRLKHLSQTARKFAIHNFSWRETALKIKPYLR